MQKNYFGVVVEIQTKKFAVLIDADNSSINAIASVLEEVAKYGIASVKRVYGDWSNDALKKWRDVLLPHAITPVQQFAYTKGKDATDMILIIDAMDLLYTRRFDGFCLVSSDSDFTGLALRIREEGLTVIGFGEQKTPDAFRNACHKFIFTEYLRPIAQPVEKEIPTQAVTNIPPASQANNTQPETIVNFTQKLPKEFVIEALENSCDHTGWAQLGTFGSYLLKLQPDFDSRLYGFKKLSLLVKARTDIFQTDERIIPGTDKKELYIRVVKN